MSACGVKHPQMPQVVCSFTYASHSGDHHDSERGVSWAWHRDDTPLKEPRACYYCERQASRIRHGVPQCGRGHAK